MRMVPADLKEVRHYKKTRNLAILEEFLASGYDCVLLENFPHKDAKTCQSSLMGSARRFGINGVAVVKRNDKIYLLKK